MEPAEASTQPTNRRRGRAIADHSFLHPVPYESGSTPVGVMTMRRSATPSGRPARRRCPIRRTTSAPGGAPSPPVRAVTSRAGVLPIAPARRRRNEQHAQDPERRGSSPRSGTARGAARRTRHPSPTGSGFAKAGATPVAPSLQSSRPGRRRHPAAPGRKLGRARGVLRRDDARGRDDPGRAKRAEAVPTLLTHAATGPC